MTWKKVLSLLMGLVVLFAGGSAYGAEEEIDTDEAAGREENVRRMVVKRYTTVEPSLVYRLCGKNTRADVRFTDSYEGERRVRRTINMGGERYNIVREFQTGKDLICMVPAEQKDTIDRLENAQTGQNLTVEGTTFGQRGAGHYVLVDRIPGGKGTQSSIGHQLRVVWQEETREPVVKMVEQKDLKNRTLRRSFNFPCRHKDGNEKLELLISQVPRKVFLSRLQKDDKEEEGVEKKYNSFRARSVHEQIQRGKVVDVEFKDRVRGNPPRIPRVVRGPNRRRVVIGTAFETYDELTCLVPRENRVLLKKAERLLEGQTVIVRGTTRPPLRSYNPVIVDEIEIPGLSGQKEKADIWIVRLIWNDDQTKMLYKVGTYRFDFPCTHAEDETERIQIDLEEVRVIRHREIEEE
ncbi:MAG: hypothetical protein ACLFWL_14730 [Candidatus Brocadiia bacterium]